MSWQPAGVERPRTKIPEPQSVAQASVRVGSVAGAGGVLRLRDAARQLLARWCEGGASAVGRR